jgi:peptide/nickel transport system permease protein
MTATVPSTDVPEIATLERAANVSVLRRLLRNPLGAVPLTFLVLVLLVAVFAPALAPQDPDLASAGDTFLPPGGDHLLGTDGSGRDIWSRLLYASRLSLATSAVAVLVAATLGITAGLVAGYYGRFTESVSSAVSSLLMALPAFVVLLAARTVLGPSAYASMAVLGVLVAPAFYRVVSASVAGVRQELYVDAARVSGLSDARIIARHVLTVVRGPAIILCAGFAGVALTVQAGLDFLGLGDPQAPSWGGMLNDAFTAIYRAPLTLLWPSLAIGLTSIALVLLGSAVSDTLARSGSPRRRRRRGRPAPETAATDAEPAVRHDEPADARGEELLHVRDLAVGYDQPDGTTTEVVHGVELSVRRGEIHGLVGESGSGKTQTAFAVLRLLSPGGRIVRGAIDFEGADLATLSEREMTRLRGRKIAYIPQEPMSNLDPVLTVGHQLTEPMRVALGINRAEARSRALDLLARVGIADPQRTFAAYPHQISGGMAQRVLIAGAVSCGPDLLIADEPTTALDVTVQAEVLDLLRDLQREFRMGVLLVTHNFGVVADLCDRVSVMRNGRIVETGPTRALFADPQHEYTRALFDAVLEDAPPRGTLTPAAADTTGGATAVGSAQGAQT